MSSPITSYLPEDVARLLESLMRRSGSDINHFRTMILTYYCHAWMLAYYDRSLITVPIMACDCGIMVPTIERPPSAPRKSVPRALAKDIEASQLIEKVYFAHQNIDTLMLAAGCMVAESPWARTWIEGRIQDPVPIDNFIIRDYFRGIIRQRNGERIH